MAQLQQFEHNIADFNPANPFAGDEKMHVQFYMGAIKNDAKTLEAGRPIFDDVECIKIFNSKDNIIDRPIRDTDKQRWPRQYMAWKAGNQEAGISGTLLENWNVLTKAQAEELKYFKIRTVEQLAEMPDSQAAGILGFQQLKTKAKLYVQMASEAAPVQKMQEALAQRDATIEAQADQLKKLAAKVEALEKKAKP